MIGQHITLEGDQVSTDSVIVPEYTLDYEGSDWPSSDIAFWHWVYNHYEVI